ncbi:MAG: mechanosensitive ion channel family protein [Pseudomonadota bacterium]
MLRLLLLVFCLSLPLILHAQGDQPSGTITVEDSAENDAAIATRIRDILGELEGYDDISVTVSSGIVTLRGTTLDASKAADLNELVGRVEGVVAIENNVTESTEVMERLNPAVERFIARFWQILAFTPLALIAIGVFLAIVLFGFFIARRKQPWNRLAPNAFIADIYRQIIRLGFIVGGLVVALDILNATALLGGILGAAGIVGLAIGFAVRDTVENFIASIMLSIRQPFRPNDAIEINGDEGKVIRLTSRATILLSFDGNHIRIPNSTVFKSRILNYSRNPERRFSFELGPAYGTDMALAEQLALDTMNALPFVLQSPAPAVWITELGGSSIGLRVTAWIDQRETGLVSAKSEAIRVALAAFDAAGIEMPEPTYRLITQGGAAPELPTGGPREARTAPPAQPVDAAQVVEDAGVQVVDTSQDKALEKLVDDERADRERPDLLRREAAEE